MAEQEMEQEVQEDEAEISVETKSGEKMETKTAQAKKEEPKREYVKEGTVKSFTTLKVEKSKVLQDFFKGVSNLCSEAILKFDKEGLHILSMDAANVAMVIGEVPNYHFQNYEAAENASYGCNILNLKTFLGRADKDSSVTLRFGDKLDISIQGKTTKKQFAMPLLADIEEKVQKIPDLKFNAVVEIKASEFEDGLKDCALVGESVVFVVKDGKFSAEARGDQKAVVLDLNGTVKADAGVVCKSKYSLEYLEKMALKGDKLKLSFSGDYPLRLDYSDLTGKLSFILAPRVDND